MTELLRKGIAVCISLFAALAFGIAGLAALSDPQMDIDQRLFMFFLNPAAGAFMATAAWAAAIERLSNRLLNAALAAAGLAVLLAARFAWLIADGQIPGTPDAPLILATAPILGLLWGSWEKILRRNE